MPERPLRLECPVCLGVRLTAKRIADGSTLEIDHCPRCGGVWFDHGEADELRRLGTPRKLRSQIPLVRGHRRMACRWCEARIQRAAAACDRCGHNVVIDCPACDRPMERESRTGLRLDVCRSCRGAWFDNDQLRAIWKSQLPAAAARSRGASRQSNDGSGWDIPHIDLNGANAGSGPELPDVTIPAVPDALAGAFDGVGSVIEAGGNAAGGAFDGVVWVIEAGGDAAGAVFEVIGSILELLFGAFDGV